MGCQQSCRSGCVSQVRCTHFPLSDVTSSDVQLHVQKYPPRGTTGAHFASGFIQSSLCFHCLFTRNCLSLLCQDFPFSSYLPSKIKFIFCLDCCHLFCCDLHRVCKIITRLIFCWSESTRGFYQHAEDSSVEFNCFYLKALARN